MIRKKIQRLQKSLSVASGIRVVSGAPADQQIYLGGGAYPDRSLTPLVLQPYVGYTDIMAGKGVEDARGELTAAAWHRLTGANDTPGPANIITNSAEYAISENAATFGQLTIKRNMVAGDTDTYVFRATLMTDGREIREYFTTRCVSVSEVPDIQFDNEAEGVYDPLRDVSEFRIHPSLTIDMPVVWSWQSYHELEGGWNTLGASLLDWAVGMDGSTNGILIDRSRMQSQLILKCCADITVDGVPVHLERTVSHTRRMPAITRSIYGIGELPEDVKTVTPHAELFAGHYRVADISELSVKWLNASGAVVGMGLNPAINLSSLGEDMDLILDVADLGGWAAIIANDKILVDSSGRVIVTRSNA